MLYSKNESILDGFSRHMEKYSEIFFHISLASTTIGLIALNIHAHCLLEEARKNLRKAGCTRFLLFPQMWKTILVNQLKTHLDNHKPDLMYMFFTGSSLLKRDYSRTFMALISVLEGDVITDEQRNHFSFLFKTSIELKSILVPFINKYQPEGCHDVDAFFNKILEGDRFSDYCESLSSSSSSESLIP